MARRFSDEKLKEMYRAYNKHLELLWDRVYKLEDQNRFLIMSQQEILAQIANGLLGGPSFVEMQHGGKSLQEERFFDLSIPREEEEIPSSGWAFSVDEINGIATVKLSKRENVDSIDLRRVRALAAPFTRLFLSNTAQNGGFLKLRIYKDVRAFFGMSTQVRRSWGDYDVLTIQNNSPFADTEYKTWGNSITVLRTSGTWSLKINNIEKPALYLDKGSVLQIDFEKLYVSGNGDGGTVPIVLYIGREV